MSATETKRDEFRRYGNVILAGDEAQAYLDRMPAKEESTPEGPDTRKWLLEELRSGVPFAGDGEDGTELYDIDAANTTMDWAAREILALAGWQAVAEQQADSIAKLERDVQRWQEAHVLAVKQREEANKYGDEEAGRYDRAEATLRSIAEGNLGDGPGQANYARIKAVALAALSHGEDELPPNWAACCSSTDLTACDCVNKQHIRVLFAKGGRKYQPIGGRL